MERDIVYIAGLHGDEILPIQALTDMGVDFVLGNPEAVQRGVRYIDEDINAVFGTNKQTLESERAKQILKEISVDQLVVDFHTTMTDTRPFVIIVDEAMIGFAKKNENSRYCFNDS